MRKFRWILPLTVAACLMGAPTHADRFKEVVVVTHVDVDPQNWIKRSSSSCRSSWIVETIPE